MSDNTEKNMQAAEATAAEETENNTEQTNEPKPMLTLEKISKGVLKLSKPIRARSKDLTELNYDFSKITGWEYVQAMDSDPDANNVFRTTNAQAFAMFAIAASKVTEDVDATDIKQRLGLSDTMRAIQVAVLFLGASAREGSAIFSGE